MDLTGYTEEELDALRHEVAVELDSRLRLVQAKQNIAQLTHEILDAGGTVEEAQAAVDEGKVAKDEADKPVEPPVEEPVEPPVEPKPKTAKKTTTKK